VVEWWSGGVVEWWLALRSPSEVGSDGIKKPAILKWLVF